ncbi:MAG: metallophosphoesterase [Deltaproteobacteria bacterium]|nr:metallophosphoesterase [Deltaproteobacteria bacterium]
MSTDVLIAHITDIHFPSMSSFEVGDLFTKRISGAFNLIANSGRRFRKHLLKESLSNISRLGASHIVISGDLGNLAFIEEYEGISSFLDESDFSPEQVTIVPGNHDVYLKSAEKNRNFWRGLGKWANATGPQDYPIEKNIDGINVIGLSSAVPSPPGIAWGKIGEKQLSDLEQILEKHSGESNILVLHHPPYRGPDSWHDGLIDGTRLREIICKWGVDIILHGHEHFDMSGSVEGPMGIRIPVFGTGCAILDNFSKPGNGARIRLLRFSGGKFIKTWVVEWKNDIGHFKPVEV